ncbi:HPP family protein, partial [Streptomyces sp. SID1046]|nr:HPP family protein [Streptomyces sp. SID1046]
MISEPVLIPSLAASAGVLHSAPTLPMAQPRSVVVAHLLGAAAGYVALALWQSNPWSAALA